MCGALMGTQVEAVLQRCVHRVDGSTVPLPVAASDGLTGVFCRCNGGGVE